MAGREQIRAVRQPPAGLFGIVPLQVEHVFHRAGQRHVLDGEHQFHPAVEIARHPVRRGQVYLALAAVFKHESPGVLQVASHDGAHVNVVAHALDFRDHAADAAHDQVDFHARASGIEQRPDDRLVRKGIHLRHDACTASGQGMPALALDQVQQCGRKLIGRGDQLLQRLRSAALQPPEKGGRVGGERRIRGEQAKVGIQPRGAVMVVAGAQVHLAARLSVHLAFKQGDLAVRLKARQAVHHAAARAREPLAPVEVVFLVKARMRLEEHLHLLAVFGGLGQRRHDGAVAADAVERLTDGAHRRVLRGQLHQMHHRSKAVVGMVEQPVAPVDLLKRVLPHQGGHLHRLGRRILQPGPLDQRVEVHQHSIQIQRPRDAVAPLTLQPELPHQKREHLLAHALLGLQTHHLAPQAAGEHLAHSGHDILARALPDGEVLVANDAEHRHMLHLILGKQAVQVMLDHILHADEALLLLDLGQVKQPGQRRRQPHQTERPRPMPGARKLDQQVELLLTGTAAPERLHLQKGPYFLFKQRFFAPDMILVQRKGGIELHALQIELATDALIEQVLGVVLMQKLTVDAAVERTPANAAELLSHLRGLVDALIAHLNELIQVGGDDGEKLGALQKRIVGIVRFFLYSPVKRKPTQFAVLDGVPLCFAFVRRTHISPSFHAPCKSVIYHYSTSKKRLSTLDAHRTAFSSFLSATGKACMPETGTDRSRRAPRRGLRTGLIRRVFMPAAPRRESGYPASPCAPLIPGRSLILARAAPHSQPGLPPAPRRRRNGKNP